MNKENHQQCTDDPDLNEINNKIKSEFDRFAVSDQSEQFYSRPAKKENTQVPGYGYDHLTTTTNNSTSLLGNAPSESWTDTSKSGSDDLNKLSKLSSKLHAYHEMNNMQVAPVLLFSDLFNGQRSNSPDRYYQNAHTGQNSESIAATTMTNTPANCPAPTDNHRLPNNSRIESGGNPPQQHFYQLNNGSRSVTTADQSIMLSKASFLNSGADINFSDLKQQKIYQGSNDQKQPTLLNVTGTTTTFEQQPDEIYHQYAASDQLSKSSTIDSNAAYSTLKLMDTASCDSSLVGGVNNLSSTDQLTKHCYPPAYTPSNFLPNNSAGNVSQIEPEADSGYRFSNEKSNKPTLSDFISGTENDYIQGPKIQLNHSQPANQINQMILNSQFKQLNQQSTSECPYQPSGNFNGHRTTIDPNSVSVNGPLLYNTNLTSSASTYPFVNLPSSYCLTSDDHSLHPHFNSHSHYLAYQQPANITVLPSKPIPSSSGKEALIQQQFANSSSLVVMSNSLPELGQQLSMNSGSIANMSENVWYKLLSRRLRERYISKRKVQDSSLSSKKCKLDQLDHGLDEKKAMGAASASIKSPFSVFYEFFLVKRCSLVPCLLIFACASLLFVICLFTIITCYFRNQQQNLLPKEHSFLLNNSPTIPLQQANSALNKINRSFNDLTPQQSQSTSSAFDLLNRLLFSLTSFLKGITAFGSSSFTSPSSDSSLPNGLTIGESTSKQTVQSESQIKLKQHQTNFWYKSAIFYEIFPASFQDSNNDGIGDLEGIISRLQYIKGLGVTALRLNSIFSALNYPYQFSKILNHTQIEKKLGEMSDFRRLVHTCHQVGLRIVLDLNPTITSDQHRWAAHFLNYQNKTNDSHNYYVNTSDYVPVNEVFHQRNFQVAKEQPGGNDQQLSGAFEDVHLNMGSHLFLNYSHPFIRSQLIRTIRFWLNEGVDGFYLTRLHEIQFNQENPEHFIQLLSSLKRQLNLANRKAATNLEFDLGVEEELDLPEPNSNQPAKILIASKESLDHLRRRLKRTLIDFWTQETRLNNSRTQFRNFSPTSMGRSSKNNATEHFSQFNGHANHLNPMESINSLNSDKNRKLTFNQFINHYFQFKRPRQAPGAQNRVVKDYFNIYSYFDLVDTFLDLRLNGSEQIRDQINEVYLANGLDDELYRDSFSIYSSTIILWTAGDHTRQRLANRLKLNSVLIAQFILTMLPGSISVFYGDEIGLKNVETVNTAKFNNGQLLPMAWSSRGLHANFTNLNEEFISNKVTRPDEIGEPPSELDIIHRKSSTNANVPWLPISIDQLIYRNSEQLQEQIQCIQQLLQFRKQYLAIMDWNLASPENVPYHQQTVNSFQSPNLKQAKFVYQTYLFHYMSNGEIVFERYYHNGKSKRRYVLFANLSNVTRRDDFSDKFYFGTIKVASEVRRLRDFLYLNSLQLEPGEALIAHIE